MTALRRLQVQLMVAMLIAGLARPAYAALPMVTVVEAAAASGPRIVVLAVVLDGKARPQLGLLEHAGETAIGRVGRFELLPVVDAFDPTGRKGRESASRQAAARVAEGQKALDDLDDPKATSSFVDALALLRQTNLATSFEALIRAWVLKAAAVATSGEVGPARQDLEKIIALAPRTELGAQFFTPELLQFADGQRRMASNAKGELTVRTEPPGAVVWVDGQYRGVSPTLVKNIMGGRHLVTAALGGYSLGQEEMTPGEGLVSLKPAELQAVLAKAQDLIGKDPEGLTREQAAMTLGKRVGAEQVLLLIGKKSLAGEQIDLTALRLDVSDGHNWAYQTAVVPMNDEATVASVLNLLVSADAPRVANRPVFHTKGAGGLSGKRTAGIVLLGAGAALVGAGVFSGLQAQSTAAAFRNTTQVQSSISEGLASRGRAFAIVADVSFVLGAASLAIGGLFVATGQSASASAEPEPADEPKPAAVTEEKREEVKEGPKKTKPVRETSDWSKPRPAEVKPTTPTTADTDSPAEVERRAKDAREAEAKKKDEEAKSAAEKREQEEHEKKTPKKKLSKKEERKLREKEEEERKAKEAEDKAEDEARKKKTDEERKAKDAEAKKKDEDAKKKKKEDDHDDLRNY